MRGSFHRVFVLFAVVGLALPALALDRECGTTENSAASETASTGVTATTEAAPASNKSCVSLPYTAHYKITRVVTQADGTILTQESSQVRAADSAGRWMTASTQPAREGQTPITQVTVADFVARTRSTWEVPGTVATVTAMRPKCAIPRPRPAKPPAEMLGHRRLMALRRRAAASPGTFPREKVGMRRRVCAHPRHGLPPTRACGPSWSAPSPIPLQARSPRNWRTSRGPNPIQPCSARPTATRL